MDNYIYTFHKFHYIYILPAYKIVKLKNISKFPIPLEWQLILINEGSLTQNLHALTGNTLNIKKYQNFSKISIHNHKNLRCIWLENSIYTKFLFARSIWILNYINNININVTTNLPLGKSIIKSEVEIYKKLHEIYYGYCQYLEEEFQKNTPMWGRKYTMYYNNKSSITIQEFFSPLIINFFY